MEPQPIDETIHEIFKYTTGLCSIERWNGASIRETRARGGQDWQEGGAVTSPIHPFPRLKGAAVMQLRPLNRWKNQNFFSGKVTGKKCVFLNTINIANDLISSYQRNVVKVPYISLYFLNAPHDTRYLIRPVGIMFEVGGVRCC